MTAGTVAAIDLGATSGRVVVGRVGPDVLKTATIARFRNTPVRVADGLHTDILALYSAALDGLRDVVRAHPGIASIGVDGWAVDYALLRDGRMLGDPYHYRDQRRARGVARVHARISHPALFARNGLQFLPFNTVYQLAAEDPTILATADTMLLLPDLIGHWLTGTTAAERTNASTTGLLRAGRWDDELIEILDLPRGILPDVVEPGDRIGTLRPDVVASIHAEHDIPVTAVGSHDTASAVVAIPIRADAAAYISCGTWGLVGVEVTDPVLTPEALAANFTNEAGVDGRIRLLHNVMGLWILNETMHSWERDGQHVDLPATLAAAADVDPTAVPVFDVNDERFLTPGDMPARITAWCVEHGIAAPGSRVEHVRAIIESLAQAFANTAADAARISTIDVRTIHIVGGGSLNELLCQRIADRSGLPVLAGPVEATALGNILIQARTAGLITGSLDALRDLVARTHEPHHYTPHTHGHQAVPRATTGEASRRE